MATDLQAPNDPPAMGGRCSILGRAAGEPLPGSAAVAESWLVVEDPGPWGRDALIESTIPGDIAAGVADLAATTSARVQLVRAPDRSSTSARRRVLYADATTASMVDLGVHDDDSLGRLDVAAGVPVEEPIYLVCTHAKRDACCAVFGRPLIAALSTATSASVWETSHTGGHRFAGVTVVLPWGLTYGRLTPEDVPGLVAATDRGEVLLPRYRGRSVDPAPAQAADVAMRRRTGVLGIGDVTTHVHDLTDTSADVLVTVKGYEHGVLLEAVTLDDQRPPSCGKDDEPITAWEVRRTELLR